MLLKILKKENCDAAALAQQQHHQHHLQQRHQQQQIQQHQQQQPQHAITQASITNMLSSDGIFSSAPFPAASATAAPSLQGNISHPMGLQVGNNASFPQASFDSNINDILRNVYLSQANLVQGPNASPNSGATSNNMLQNLIQN